MKCVGYDRDFQLELCDKFPGWTPPENPKTQKPKEPKGRKTKKSKRESKALSPRPSTSKGKKRKRAADSDGDSEQVMDIDEADGKSDFSDSEAELLYKIQSRGTRYRPIHVD